jgi:response regulator RpfG family c-di-GMP phosphodiesterase
MKVLLVIDDSADRYSHISGLLSDHDVIVCCVQSPDAAEILLQTSRVFAVMLGHDMINWNGQNYAKEVLGEAAIPVCVTSGNYAAAELFDQIFSDMGVEHVVISVNQKEHNLRWMSWILGLLYKKEEGDLHDRMYRALQEIERLVSDYDGENTTFDLTKDPNVVVELVKYHLDLADDVAYSVMMGHTP